MRDVLSAAKPRGRSGHAAGLAVRADERMRDAGRRVDRLARLAEIGLDRRVASQAWSRLARADGLHEDCRAAGISMTTEVGRTVVE